MKILHIAPYIFDKNIKGFDRNSTGFGMMVNSIVQYQKKYLENKKSSNEIHLLTYSIISNEEKNKAQYSIESTSLHELIFNFRFRDIGYIRENLKIYNGNLKNKIHTIYHSLNKKVFEKKIREIKPDIIHIHGSSKPIIDAAIDSGYKFLITLHGLNAFREDYGEPFRNYEKKLLLNAFNNDYYISTISSGMKETIEQRILNNKSADNIKVILNGIDIDFNTIDKDISEDNLKNAINFITVGNITENKNQMQTIRSLSIFKKEVPNFILNICGRDTTNGEIIKLVEELGLQDNVVFHGFVDREKLYKLYSNADFNIVASKVEGFGLSFIEAFSFGVPSISFCDIESIKDIYSKYSLELCDIRDDEEFSNTIKKATEKQWEKIKIIEHGKKFHIENIIEKYLSLYNEIIEGR